MRIEEKEESKYGSGAQIPTLYCILESPEKLIRNLDAQLITGHQLNRIV